MSCARAARISNLVMAMSCQGCTDESAHSGGGQGTCGRQQGHSGGSCAHLVRLCHTKAKHSIWAGWRTSEHCSGGRLRVPCGRARARRCCPVPGQQPDADVRPGQSLPRTVLPRCPLWLHSANHNRAISLGQHKHDYQAGAALFTPANNAEHICAQVRPLSAICGTREIAPSGSPKCRAGARSVQKPGTQRKQPGCLRSLPRHDPGHRNGGTALYACHRLQSQ